MCRIRLAHLFFIIIFLVMAKCCLSFVNGLLRRFSSQVFALLLVGFTFCGMAEARNVRDLWLSMPDSIVPYLNSGLRTQCIDLYDMKSDALTDNLLKGKSRIDTLTTTFLKATLSSSCEMQMKILPCAGTDSVLCVVSSFGGSEGESEVRFYSLDWKPVGEPMSFHINDFVVRPDSMPGDRYNYLLSCLDPVMFVATLSVSDNSIVVVPVNTAVSLDDKKALIPILLQRKLNWDGKTFKYCYK